VKVVRVKVVRVKVVRVKVVRVMAAAAVLRRPVQEMVGMAVVAARNHPT